MIFDPFFWKPRSRVNNPTYSSTLLQSAMMIPSQNKPIQKSHKQLSMVKKSHSQIVLPHYLKNDQSKQSTLILPKINTLIKNPPVQPKLQPKIKTSSIQPIKSGQILQQKLNKLLQNNKSTEKHKFYTSSKDIFQKHLRNFDIIKNTQINYKSTVGLFPKFHLQKLDNQYQTRKAFLRGDLSMIHKIKSQNFNRKDAERSKSMFSQRKQHNIFRRIEPIDKAFKITQNPQIISKKLVLEK